MVKMSSRKEILEFLSRFAACVEAAAVGTSRDRDYDELCDVIRAQEKSHRAFGRRLVGGAATSGRMSVQKAVDYFVARTIADAMLKENPSERPISTLIGVRGDYIRAAIMVADPNFRRVLASELAKVWPNETAIEVCKRVWACDYSELVSS